jgi:tetratricopeptide (TPR) repeat protein
MSDRLMTRTLTALTVCAIALGNFAQAADDGLADINRQIAKQHAEAVTRLQKWIALPSIAAEGRLAAAVALQPDFELIPVTTDQFVRIDDSPTYRFVGAGDPLRLMPDENGQQRSIERHDTQQTPSELLAAGSVSAAREAYRHAFSISPRDRSLQRARLDELRNAALARGDAKTAVALLAISAERYPQSALAQYDLSLAQVVDGDRGAAIAGLRKSLALLASDPEIADFYESARYETSKRLQLLGDSP